MSGSQAIGTGSDDDVHDVHDVHVNMYMNNGDQLDARNDSTGRSSHSLRHPSPSLMIQPLMRPGPGSASRSATRTGSNPRESGILRRLSYDELARDGSNPRTRTPMRYESPSNTTNVNVNANANAPLLRPATDRSSTAIAAQRTTMEGQRVTVRPLAGAAVGTTLAPRRVSFIMCLEIFPSVHPVIYSHV